MTITTAKWTLKDYHRMIEVGLLENSQVELLNGEIIEMSPESPEHAQQNTNAADYLKGLLGDRAVVRDAKPVTLLDYHAETILSSGTVSPLAFPDLTIAVQRLLKE